MSTVSIVVITVFGLLGLSTFIGNIRLAKSKKRNEQLFSQVAEHVYDVLSDCAGENLELSRFMTDSSQYFFIAKSKKDDVFAVVFLDRFFITKLSAKRKCDCQINWENKTKFNSIVCTIISDDQNEPFSVTLCSKPHRNNFIGKMYLDIARDFTEETQNN